MGWGKAYLGNLPSIQISYDRSLRWIDTHLRRNRLITLRPRVWFSFHVISSDEVEICPFPGGKFELPTSLSKCTDQLIILKSLTMAPPKIHRFLGVVGKERVSCLIRNVLRSRSQHLHSPPKKSFSLSETLCRAAVQGPRVHRGRYENVQEKVNPFPFFQIIKPLP